MSQERKDKEILFIGEFPPPFTGVTVKDDLLVREVLSDSFDVDVFNLYRFKFERLKAPLLALKLIVSIRRAERICVGVGHPFRTCMVFRVARLLHGRDWLTNITVFMMGIGTPSYLHDHPRYVPDVARGRCVFTESDSLNDQLSELGIANGRYLPNFRKGDRARSPRPVGEVVHFVYFAQVRREKGADTLLDAVRLLNGEGLERRFDLTMYGGVAPEFEKDFEALLCGLENVRYAGIFDTSTNDVYEELNQYDSSSSSSWLEGMSGTNIECKFAGIANIVGDGGLNRECVEDGIDGFVVPAGSVEALAGAMRSVIEDHDLLERMKWASYESRVSYDVDTWRDVVLDVIE